jgi:hypothetical protein
LSKQCNINTFALISYQVTLPDNISFGHCSVKCKVTKILLVKNVGTGTVKFMMSSMHSTLTCPNEVSEIL